jgi:hypothetical protein
MKRNILNRLIANCSESNATTRGSSVKKRLVLCACVFACCIVSVLGVRAYNSKGPAPNRPLDYNLRAPAPDSSPIKSATVAENHSPVARVTQQVPIKPKLTDSVLVTITPGGFNTAQITSPAIPFFLLIENCSGLSEVSLRLDRVAGSRLRQVMVGREQPDWADLLDLTPGDYVLSEANHPDWICHITVAPH